jgi:hypothetical protein
MKIGDEFPLQVYSEICCDLCGDVIHNHIDCPVCNVQYAATDQYCHLYGEKELTCEECGTVFSKTGESWYYDCTAQVVSLKD